MCTKNDFVYGELGRFNCQYVRYFNVIKYWVKLLHANDNKYVKKCIAPIKRSVYTKLEWKTGIIK